MKGARPVELEDLDHAVPLGKRAPPGWEESIVDHGSKVIREIIAG